MIMHGVDGFDDEAAELRSILEASGVVGTWDWDFVRRTVRYDRGAARLLACDPNLAGRDLDGATARTGVHPDDLDWLAKEVMRVMKVGGVFMAEYRVITREGQIRWLFSRGRIYKDRRGETVRGCGVLIDITDSREVGDRYVMSPLTLSADPLDDAAQLCITLRERLQADGVGELSVMADTMLMAIGHEISRRLRRRSPFG